jgi:hypothetical protein
VNPRSFCEEREYPFALGLTYSFDPAFFDRLPARALRTGGSREVLVLADGREVDRAVAAVRGPIHHLGRRYQLAPVRMAGAFHPKLLLRMGRQGGIVAVGSGNLTHGGWGLNREVAAAWRVGPGLEDSGGWIPGLLDRCAAWAAAPLAEQTVDRMREVPWLADAPVGRLLFSGPRSLAAQIQDRWVGRRFTELRFVTGSTDRQGQVLRWLHRTFGVVRATGCVTPTRCDWQTSRLADLPLDLRLSAHPAPYAHAKAYHLAGPDGDVLLVGSANCSAAAWLNPPTTGGNVEMLLVYEDPTHEDLAVLDELLETPARPLGEVLTDRPETDAEQEESEDDEGPPLALTALQFEQDGSVLVRLAGSVQEDMRYRAILGEEAIPLEVEQEALVGPAPDALPAGRTAFGHVEGEAPDGTPVRSAVRWVDDLRWLGQSGTLKDIEAAFEQWNRPPPGRQDDQVRQELARVANAILTDATAIPDPLFGRSRRRSGEDGPELDVPLVDPSKLIQDLRDTAGPGRTIGRGREEGGLSLAGVFRAIFGGPDDEEDPAAGEHGVAPAEKEREEPDDVGAPETDPGADQAGSEKGAQPARSVDTTPVAEKARERFEKDMDAFMTKLRDPAFRKRCNPARLAQAIAFPFAAAEVGLDRKWTDPKRSREWLVAAARLLLEPGEDGELSLLDEMRQRYDAEQAERFELSLGDGKLWVTLVVGLARARWPGADATLDRMLLLRSVWDCKALRSRADQGRLERLIRSHRSGAALAVLEEVVAPLASGLSKLESRMAALIEEGLLEALDGEPVGSGDLLWSPKNGWAVATGDQQGTFIPVYWADKGRAAKMCRQRSGFASVAQAGLLDDLVRGSHESLLDALSVLVER